MIITLESLSDCMQLNKVTVRHFFENYQLQRFYNRYSKTINLTEECFNILSTYLECRISYSKHRNALFKLQSLKKSLK